MSYQSATQPDEEDPQSPDLMFLDSTYNQRAYRCFAHCFCLWQVFWVGLATSIQVSQGTFNLVLITALTTALLSWLAFDDTGFSNQAAILWLFSGCSTMLVLVYPLFVMGFDHGPAWLQIGVAWPVGMLAVPSTIAMLVTGVAALMDEF